LLEVLAEVQRGAGERWGTRRRNGRRRRAEVLASSAVLDSMERPRVRIGRAVVTTTVVLWVLEWLSAGPIGPDESLAIALWVSAVLGALTVAVHRLDRRRLPVGYQLLALALVAGTVSSSVHVAFLLVAAAAHELATYESSRSLAATAAIGFFDGDALFGFWALLAELPRRIGAERRLEEERHALRQEAELARIRAALEPHFVLNTLNTIAGLVTSEPREARMLIGTLGDLLRDTMQESQGPTTRCARRLAGCAASPAS